jgi:hypothetical protein
MASAGGSSIVGIHLGRSGFIVAAAPHDGGAGLTRPLDVAINALGHRRTPCCVSWATASATWQVGEAALSRLQSAPATTFDRVLDPAWTASAAAGGGAGDADEAIAETVAARVVALLDEAAKDAERCANRRTATIAGVSVPVAAPPLVLSALERAASAVATASASPAIPRLVLIPAPLAAVAGLPVPPCRPDSVTHVLVVRVGHSSLDAAVVRVAAMAADSADFAVPVALWSRTLNSALALPQHSTSLVTSESRYSMSVAGSSAWLACGVEAVDERIVESALEMLTPAAKSALRPRVRARWLRTIREARELVAKGAASEHLELEVNDETAAFPLSQRLLAHCARDVRAAVASAAKSAIAAADLQPAVVTHVVCIGGGANLPGVLEAVAQAGPERSSLLTRPAPTSSPSGAPTWRCAMRRTTPPHSARRGACLHRHPTDINRWGLLCCSAAAMTARRTSCRRRTRSHRPAAASMWACRPPSPTPLSVSSSCRTVKCCVNSAAEHFCADHGEPARSAGVCIAGHLRRRREPGCVCRRRGCCAGVDRGRPRGEWLPLVRAASRGLTPRPVVCACVFCTLVRHQCVTPCSNAPVYCSPSLLHTHVVAPSSTTAAWPLPYAARRRPSAAAAGAAS